MFFTFYNLETRRTELTERNEPPHDKTNEMSVPPAKTQISLGIRPVWSESLLSAWRKLGSLATHLVHSEDSDQTGWMPRLIWVFAGRTVTLLVLSCRSSHALSNDNKRHVMRKPVFGGFWPGKTQTGLLIYCYRIEILDLASTCICIILSWQGTTMVLISLHRFAGWSASLLFACHKQLFSGCGSEINDETEHI